MAQQNPGPTQARSQQYSQFTANSEALGPSLFIGEDDMDDMDDLQVVEGTSKKSISNTAPKCTCTCSHHSTKEGVEATSQPKADLIQLRVGDDQAFFLAEKSRLENASSFFLACLSGKFKEQDVVSLPGDSPLVVGWFVRWIYTGDLPDLVKHKKSELSSDVLWANLHLYAERHQSLKFGYALLKALHQKMLDFMAKKKSAIALIHFAPYIDPYYIEKVFLDLGRKFGITKMIMTFLFMVLQAPKPDIDGSKYSDRVRTEIGNIVLSGGIHTTKAQPFPPLDCFMLEPK